MSLPVIMGVLNVTPDSFSDGGQFTSVPHAVEHAARMVEQGAAIIDVGGESTRPGASAVGVEDELERVLPVIEALQSELPVPISIDTSKPPVMQAAVSAGAGLINDVYALRRENALAVAAASGAAVCLMHMQGEPRTMQDAPDYPGGVVACVANFLQERVKCCENAGISRDRLLIDPGFGFGKTLPQNLQLLAELPTLRRIGVPLLVGLSRKSMIGALLDLDVDARTLPSVVLALMAVERGARIVRVHDVAETRQALHLYRMVQAQKGA